MVTRRSVSGMKLDIEFNGTSIDVTASAGYASLLPGETASDLIARADAALYSAKQNGRDRAEPAGLPDPDRNLQPA